MTDKELLEMAAMAVGIDGVFEVDCIRVPHGKHGFTCWSPLTDDGDSLRLAVTLNIAISFPLGNGKFSAVTAGQVGSSAVGCHELFSSDQYAATRRAIVRAAAEIGRLK